MSRYDLTDFEWRVIEPLLPSESPRLRHPPNRRINRSRSVDPLDRFAQKNAKVPRIRTRLDIGQYRHAGFSRQFLQSPDRRFAEVLRAVALPDVVPALMIGGQLVAKHFSTTCCRAGIAVSTGT